VKSRLAVLTQKHHVTESVLLKQMVEVILLQSTGVIEAQLAHSVDTGPHDAWVYAKLRPEDHVLLRERAAGRGMPTATYASIALRARLRRVSPLPGVRAPL